MALTIKINGKEETVDKDNASVTELLALKDVKMPEMVSVELNGEILDRDKFESTSVNEGDVFEFLYFQDLSYLLFFHQF